MTPHCLTSAGGSGVECLPNECYADVCLSGFVFRLRIAVDKEDLALAIGKRGQNARLTSRLTGWEIDIKEDRSAAEAFEQQLGGAVHQLADALGISEEEAKTLAAGGMNSVDVVVTAEASDIDGVLSCGPEKAESILAAAKSHLEAKGQAAA